MAASADDLGRSHRSGGAAVDGARAAVRLLAVACPRPCHPCCAVGRVAVPPGRVRQPAPPRRDDGHTRLGRRGRRIPLVALGAALHPCGHTRHEDDTESLCEQRRRRPSLSGSRRCRHHLHPRRALFRVTRQTAVRCCAARTARPGRQGGRCSTRRIDRNTHSDRPTRRRRCIRRTPGREDRHRRRRGFGHVSGGRVDADG